MILFNLRVKLVLKCKNEAKLWIYDYNCAMEGIDIYEIIKLSKNGEESFIRYKIFTHLLDRTTWNSYVLYKK